MSTEDNDKIIAELKAEIEALRTVISMTPGNVYWKNTDNIYMGCNNNVANLLSFSSFEDIVGKSAADIMPAELAKEIDQTDLSVILNGQEVCVEEVGYHADGTTPAVYLSRKVPLHDRNQQIKGMLGISFDITERKKFEETLRIAKEKAEAANRAKSQFLAMISHELRTPLTSILGFANLLESALPQHEKQEYIKHIANSGAYLLSLINSVLDYNKLENNKFELTQLPFNLKELIESVINMLSSNAKLKNLPLIFGFPDNIPQQMIGNSRALRQILINLIGNAIKFTEKGQVTVSIHLLKQTEDHINVQIIVTDTGVGIPSNEQQYIFKRFYQLGNVYTRNASLTGTGLGLAIVKKLIKLLKGKITVESKVNQGSTFTVTLPFQLNLHTSLPWLPYASNVKILVIQDKILRNNIHTMLENTMYDTSSSKEAISTLLSAHRSLQHYDIVLIDDNLKFADPDNLFKNIRQQNQLQQPLLILLTSESTATNSLFSEIQLQPDSTDIIAFQENLRLAWENWLANSGKFIGPSQNTRNPYVLLIEDNQLIQIIHTHMLEELGCKVDVTDSANDALNMLPNQYDMLFVDIGLPDIAGFELIQKIRQQHSGYTQMPIVVLTGYSEDEERDRCLRVGANEVAIKPVSKDTLQNIIDRYIIRN